MRIEINLINALYNSSANVCVPHTLLAHNFKIRKEFVNHEEKQDILQCSI